MLYKKNPSAYTRYEKCRHIDRDNEECKVTNDKWLVCDDSGECRQFSQEGVNMKANEAKLVNIGDIVRCIDKGCFNKLTVGNIYNVVNVEIFSNDVVFIKVVNDKGCVVGYPSEYFEIGIKDELDVDLSAKYHIPTYDKETYIGVESNDSGNNNPIKPNHYNSGKFDVIDFCFRHNLDFASGNVVKYIVRAGKKDKNKELEDLLKAKEYLNRRIERVKAND